jgi:hypothetical protein
MTEQNTLTTEQEVERIVSAFLDLPPSGRSSHALWLRDILTPLIEDRNARAREVEQICAQRSREIGKMLVAYYESNTEPDGELRKKWFVKMVKQLADTLLSHGIDLSKPNN